ncbi:MAG: hypothetical protein HND56_02890 [Pseudomonadota bacterium]|nr:hypothetical protein [Pseudomonadota bacterium]QKK04698.1 MAG: hypothetical protein HND56_02890 [Pseudomonadota bacterium]
MNEKKPRITRIEIGMTPELRDADELQIDFKSGEVMAIKDGQKIPLKINGTQLSHFRSKGNKIITETPQRESLGYRVDEMASFADYDFVFVVDTNSALSEKGRFHVSCITHICVDEGENEYNLDINAKMLSFVFPDMGYDEPEKVAWALLLNQKFLRMLVNSGKRIGIVVDSALSDIPKLNDGKIPLFENYFLPKNVTLIYASADKSDMLFNRLIKYMDKEANKLKADILSGEVIPFYIKIMPLCSKNNVYWSATKLGPVLTSNVSPKSGFVLRENTPVILVGVERDGDGNEILHHLKTFNVPPEEDR